MASSRIDAPLLSGIPMSDTATTATPSHHAPTMSAGNPVILRSDYTPPAFLIDTVDLCFDLDPQRTVTENRMTIRRNPAHIGVAACLALVGEELELLSATLNGTPCSPRLVPGGLEIDAPPD